MDKEYFARWKLNRSTRIDEINVTLHVSEMGKPILCGIEKRYPDIYEYGFDPLQSIHDGFNVCKNCVKCYNKLKRKNENNT